MDSMFSTTAKFGADYDGSNMIKITNEADGLYAISEALKSLNDAKKAILDAGTNAINSVGGELKPKFTQIFNTGNDAVFSNINTIVQQFMDRYSEAMSAWGSVEKEIDDAMAIALSSIQNISQGSSSDGTQQ